MTIDEQFEKLENTVREYNPGADFKRIRESYEFAKLHHGEQRRKSGELYITHPLAVAQIVAEELHLDTESIVAALLHDCTKKLDMPEQLALCKQYGIELDALEQKALKLLHSKTGAAIARDVFGVEDAVYDAIWYHTTGKPDMTLLEKIIYLADYIEPSRDFDGVEELRKVVWEDIDRGLAMGLAMTVEEMEERGNPVHHNTLEALDELRGHSHE